ncbi:sensor histidine kinase [Phytohabitans kaempferiae]|uniref:histidine kinase n=1 Tax=Phytohabitans kaempferiae TaxID=1620943 RepID=A0ABV6M2N2_9ACTN
MGRRVAWAACLVTVAAVAGAMALGAVNGTDPGTRAYLVFVVSCAVAGGLVAGERPREPLGWLLLGSAFSFGVLELCGEYAVHGQLTRPAGGSYPEIATWTATWLWVPANLCAALVPLFFPGGRRLARRWWWLVGPVLAAAAVAAVLSALRPGTPDQIRAYPQVTNPLGVAGLAGAADLAGAVFTVLAGLAFAVGGVAVLLRAREADEVRRRQVKWVVWALAVAAVAVVARLVAGLTDADAGSLWPRDSLFWEYAGALALSLVPAAVTVAVLRHRLYDIDVLINRTLVYTVLSACLVGGYVLIAAYLGALVGRSGSRPVAVVAAAAVAVGFAPLRERIQHGINLMLYGRREDPYAVLARLGRRLEQAVTPAGVLPVIAETVAETLRLRYVAVEVTGGEPVVSGTADGVPERLPLTYHGEEVGSLWLWPPLAESGGRGRRGALDPHVLADLVRHVGVAVHAVRETERSVALSADLQRSRERLVMAREEERRRLRRDLHDGLGPTLAALTMRAEAAQDATGDEAKALLARVVDDAESAVGDVRRLVEGLRPPALDSLGLVGALRAHVAGLPAGAPRVTVDAADPLPPLPAATEVAAYRIVLEAVTNVVRHARASSATVTLRLADARLTLEVADDGRGQVPRQPTATGAPAPRGADGAGPAASGADGAGPAASGADGAGPAASGADGAGPAASGADGAGPAAGSAGGVGIMSMRERAAELGGTLTVVSGTGGTRVRAELPAVTEE